MPRIRTIKPEFCQSPSTGHLSREARLFFVQLLTDVDDDGRCVWSAKRLAGSLYPWDDDVEAGQVVEWVEECERVGMLRRYDADGTPVLAVVNFAKHQRVSHPSPSRLPPPPENSASPDAREASGEIREDCANDSAGAPEVLRPEVETEVETEGKGKPLAPVGAEVVALGSGRSRDLLFEAVVDACRIDCSSIPPSARGGYNRALKDLRTVGATPADVHQRANYYRMHFPHAALTPNALAKHWALCANPPPTQIRGADVLSRFIEEGSR